MATGRNWKSKVTAYLNGPKTQKTLLTLAGYAAGVYGGPSAKAAVDEYGPTVAEWLVTAASYLFGA